MNVQLTANQALAAKRIMANTAYSGVGSMISSSSRSSTYKHDIEYDFGYPRSNELGFNLFYEMWKRRGIAHGLCAKTANKTWQEAPVLVEDGDEHEETKIEAEVAKHFQRIRFWQQLQEADMRGMVGKYSAIIFQLGDGQLYSKPVDKVPGGIEGIISVIPAWEGQLKPSSWDTDVKSPNYGKPTMYLFNENAVDANNKQARSFEVHPDRCIIWSRDGSTFCESKLESCYNALMDVDKIRGGGAEGFWKNAKSQPVLTASEDVDFNMLSQMLGTDLEGLPDALDDVVRKWSKGFDESLMLQGMSATTLAVEMESPEHFHNIAVQEISAAWPIPQKELIGMQTGERASTEDSKAWAQTNMNRRSSLVIPNIMDIVDRFISWGVLADVGWEVSWADLTAPTITEKIEIAEKMAKINQAMFATGEAVFTDDEIRDVVGYDALEDSGFTEPVEEEDDEDDI